MSKAENESTKAVRELTDKEAETVTGGMKAATDGQKSWWRTIVDFFFKIKS